MNWWIDGRQRTVLNGFLEWSAVESVSQGSVFGLLIFVIFFNNFDDCANLIIVTRTDLIQTLKILSGYDDVNKNIWFHKVRTDIHTSYHRNLIPRRFQTDMRANISTQAEL